MSLITYEPWNTLSRFQQQLNQRHCLGKSFMQSHGDSAGDDNAISWQPAVDIKEEAEQFVITADVPGVAPKDIEVTLENQTLAIKGKRISKAATDQDGYAQVERVSGMFCRYFRVPDTTAIEDIKAVAKEGVLEIVLPKKARAKAQKIEVQS